jgi:signal transduction histidine kinase
VAASTQIAVLSSARRPRILAWILWSLTLAFVIAAAITLIGNGSFAGGGAHWGLVLVFVTVMVCATVGGMIASRLRGNPIGWLLLAIGLALSFGAFAEQYAVRGILSAPGSVPAPRTVASLANWTTVFALASLVLVFLLFPDGRPPSPRWRPVVWAAVAVDAVGTVGFAIERGNVDGMLNLLQDQHAGFPSTVGLVSAHGPLSAVLGVVGFLGLGLWGAAIVGLFLRRHRGSPELRQQLAWLGYVGVTAVVLLLVLIAYGIANGGKDDVPSTVLFSALAATVFLGIPLACGIAVLRYRLYDLDVVVKKTVVFGALAALFTAVYVGVVIGVGAAVGDRGNSALTFAAAALIALAFQPFRERARRLADRLVYGKRATPYEVLSGFAERVGETYSTDDVLLRMAQILGAGTGARRAEVWLRVGSEYRLEARWPQEGGPPATAISAHGADDLPAFEGVDGAFPVRHRGDLLGALAVSMPPDEPLVGSKEKLIGDLAAQAGLVLRNVRLIEELRASRERLVTAQDEERRRLERNIHDGAQQQLVALAIKVRLTHGLMRRDVDKAEALLEQTGQELTEALETLRELARGIYPPLLVDRGLPEALTAQARKAPLPVEVDADGVGRYPQNTEAAVYFCCLEALQNVAKYASATAAVVSLREEDGALTFTVSDDGKGFDTAAKRAGTGVQGMADRLEALGGSLAIRSSPGEGTIVTGRLPVSRS